MTPQPHVPAFVINTTYRLHPDDAPAYKALAARFAMAANDWDGCEFVSVGQDVLDPTMFHLVEGWRDREVFDAFGVTPTFQAIISEALQLRILDRFGDMIFVSGMDTLDMPT